MIIVTTYTISGYDVVETLGFVCGNTVRARNVTKDVQAVMENLVGGEVEHYTKLLAEAREQAMDRLIAQANAKGADAVVGLRFSTSEIATSAAEIMCYGTAVKLKESV